MDLLTFPLGVRFFPFPSWFCRKGWLMVIMLKGEEKRRWKEDENEKENVRNVCYNNREG